MTTIPSRLPHLRDALDRLLDQSFGDFELNLYIPEVCERTDESYVVPGHLSRYAETVRIFRVGADYGPATKLLAPLQAGHVHRPGAVITVDDDVLLERHTLQELVEAATRYPKSAIGFMGVLSGEYIHAEALAAHRVADAEVDILGGYRGILYPSEILDDSLFEDYNAIAARCRPFLDDDHLFAWNLARRGVPRRVIATQYPGAESALNIHLLDLPDSITFGSDEGAGVRRSHTTLRRYYQGRGWDYPE